MQRRNFRLTKIICTIGPSSRSLEMIEQLARAGMNIARLNMSHGTHADHAEVFQAIKTLNKRLNHPIATLVDLQGPEIRTGELKENIELKVGDIFSFTVVPDENPEEKSVFVNYEHLINDLQIGDKVTVDNGLINLEVLEKTYRHLRCRVLDGGTLGSRRHVNLPGIRVKLPSITAKDKRDIAFAIEHEADFIAPSFVRHKDDILEARKYILKHKGHAKIIAKIENEEGVENFAGILDESDGIMVARGDLGVEVPNEELPVIQRSMVQQCILAGKPVIVATHLLESMINHPTPTRAEITDVANAVYEQADAIMLSGETAAGKFPLRCVETLDRIARRMEKEPALALERTPEDLREELAKSACRLADSLEALAILVFTRRGVLGQLVTSFRPKTAIIYAFTNSAVTLRQLWLNRGVVPFKMDFSADPEKTVRAAFEKLRFHHRVLPGDKIVVISDVDAAGDRVTSIQVRTFQ